MIVSGSVLRLLAAAIRAKSETASASPRSDGSTPAARKTTSAAAAEPAHAASAERSVLRRCENAASITANVSSRPAVACTVAASAAECRTSDTSPESTRGTGQKTARPTDPARRAVAYQASFADGTPYVRLPGGALIRSATSACTITSPRASDGTVASRCNTTGTDTLYG